MEYGGGMTLNGTFHYNNFFLTFLYKHQSSDKIKVVLDFHSTSTTLFSATLEACAVPHKSACNAWKAPTKVPMMPAKVPAMPAMPPMKRENPEKPEELRIIVFSQKYFKKVPAKCLQRLQSTYNGSHDACKGSSNACKGVFGFLECQSSQIC